MGFCFFVFFLWDVFFETHYTSQECFNNINTLPFPSPQLDIEYRKKWDSLVIKLEVVDRDARTGSEVVHWATHFPVSL